MQSTTGVDVLRTLDAQATHLKKWPGTASMERLLRSRHPPEGGLRTCKRSAPSLERCTSISQGGGGFPSWHPHLLVVVAFYRSATQWHRYHEHRLVNRHRSHAGKSALRAIGRRLPRDSLSIFNCSFLTRLRRGPSAILIASSIPAQFSPSPGNPPSVFRFPV